MDLVILDIMMGELSGFGLARILKRRSETSDIPIIFCSALDTADDKVKGLDIGADDYITKPFSMEEVVFRIEAILRRVHGKKNRDMTIRQIGSDVHRFMKLFAHILKENAHYIPKALRFCRFSL